MNDWLILRTIELGYQLFLITIRTYVAFSFVHVLRIEEHIQHFVRTSIISSFFRVLRVFAKHFFEMLCYAIILALMICPQGSDNVLQ